MKKLLCTLLFLPLVSFAHPERCPPVEAIKSFGINPRLFADSDGDWYGGRSSLRYDTTDLWTFVILHIKSRNNDDAYKKGVKALKRLRFKSGPLKGRNEAEWYCLYDAEKYSAVAITPPLKGIPKLPGLF